ncbi:hypothetical protein CUJ83_10190 [Methanocella sp. CWC-04]|uniref:Uncharacterized protein n=1 Tax=Methanooceanicella nereidis TaxID=2052831 RepID=A0AAP2RFP8_9EURY|nr:hypothetical protein [Methanocella sp. CWC-04]
MDVRTILSAVGSAAKAREAPLVHMNKAPMSKTTNRLAIILFFDILLKPPFSREHRKAKENMQ